MQWSYSLGMLWIFIPIEHTQSRCHSDNGENDWVGSPKWVRVAWTMEHDYLMEFLGCFEDCHPTDGGNNSGV